MAPSLLRRNSSLAQIEVARTTSFITDDGQRATVSEFINDLGFGWYQVQAFLLCAGFIVAEGACLQTASGISQAIVLEFELDSPLSRSALMSLTFAGFAVGTVASGPIADTLGRRWPMLMGYIGVVTTAVSVFHSTGSFAIVLLLFFLLGCSAGLGIPAALIVNSEVTPDSLRGVSTAALGVAFSIGELWASLGLRSTLPDLKNGPWRVAVLWAALPAGCLLLFGACSRVSRYDTPHFLAVQGSSQQLIGAINHIAEMNGRPELVLTGLPKIEQQKALELTQALPELLRWPSVKYVAVLSALFFAKDFGLYGMGVFWPLAWRRAGGFGAEMEQATELALTATVGLPGVGLAMLLMYSLPRRVGLSLSAGFCAVAAICLQGLLSGHALGLFGVLVYKLLFPTWQMVVMLLPSEVFPTQVRAWSWSIVGFSGRVATVVAPIVVNGSKVGFLRLNAALALVSLALVWALPETKDCELQNLAPALDEEGALGAALGAVGRSHSSLGQKKDDNVGKAPRASGVGGEGQYGSV